GAGEAHESGVREVGGRGPGAWDERPYALAEEGTGLVARLPWLVEFDRFDPAGPFGTEGDHVELDGNFPVVTFEHGSDAMPSLLGFAVFLVFAVAGDELSHCFHIGFASSIDSAAA